MTAVKLFPRLPRHVARPLADELSSLGNVEAAERASSGHEAAQFVVEGRGVGMTALLQGERQIPEVTPEDDEEDPQKCQRSQWDGEVGSKAQEHGIEREEQQVGP